MRLVDYTAFAVVLLCGVCAVLGVVRELLLLAIDVARDHVQTDRRRVYTKENSWF